MKKNALLLLLFVLGTNVFAQDIPIPTCNSGFYVNSGHTKIDKLSCLGFDNLLFAYEIKDEVFNYDCIIVNINFSGESSSNKPIVTPQSKGIFSEKIPVANLKGKKYNYEMIFPTSNVSIVSKYWFKSLLTYDGVTVTKENFMPYLKGENSKMQVIIWGALKTGTKVDYNSSTGTSFTSPTFEYKELYKSSELVIHNDQYATAESPKAGNSILRSNCYPVYNGPKEIGEIPGF